MAIAENEASAAKAILSSMVRAIIILSEAIACQEQSLNLIIS